MIAPNAPLRNQASIRPQPARQQNVLKDALQRR
jgi:hypothetical protein